MMAIIILVAGILLITIIVTVIKIIKLRQRSAKIFFRVTSIIVVERHLILFVR